MFKRILLAAAAKVCPVAFAGTNAGGALFVCATNQEAPLDVDDFEDLQWVQVKNLGSHGEAGSETNILNYDTWDTDVIQKLKGTTDAGSPTVELLRLPTDPGQMILRTAALNPLNYAFKLVKNDKTFPQGLGTTIYNRGIVTGPKRPLGRNEDFDLEVFTLGFQQREIVVPPTTPTP